MMLYLFRKSLVDFWDHFMAAVVYNLASLGLVAFMAFSPYWAGGLWWAVCALSLGIWLALGPWLAGKLEEKRPVSLVRSLLWGLGTSLVTLLAASAVVWYLSQDSLGAWIPGFLAFWLLLSLAGLFTVLQFFTSLIPEKGRPVLSDTVLLLLSRPTLILQSLLISILSLASLVIFLPGPALGLFWGINLREILEEGLAQTREGKTPDWKSLETTRSRELQKRSWISLIFPWRD